jgi:hypothetical protein
MGANDNPSLASHSLIPNAKVYNLPRHLGPILLFISCHQTKQHKCPASSLPTWSVPWFRKQTIPDQTSLKKKPSREQVLLSVLSVPVLSSSADLYLSLRFPSYPRSLCVSCFPPSLTQAARERVWPVVVNKRGKDASAKPFRTKEKWWKTMMIQLADRKMANMRLPGQSKRCAEQRQKEDLMGENGRKKRGLQDCRQYVS